MGEGADIAEDALVDVEDGDGESGKEQCQSDGSEIVIAQPEDFGTVEVAGVGEPAHGLIPSAQELGAVVDLIRREKVRAVFSEKSFPASLLDVVRKEGGARVYVISHIATGSYTADKFENEMQRNVDEMVKALVTDAGE